MQKPIRVGSSNQGAGYTIIGNSQSAEISGGGPYIAQAQYGTIGQSRVVRVGGVGVTREERFKQPYEPYQARVEAQVPNSKF